MKRCIECNDRPARHWSSSFCEECFKKLLREKLEEDESIFEQHAVAHPNLYYKD